MYLHYQLNQFESAFFKRNIATATIQTTPYVENVSADLIAIKLNANEQKYIDFIQAKGFKFVEGEICFNLFPKEAFPLKYHIIRLSEQNLAQLALFSHQITFNSRFKEPYFSLRENSAFYATWFENAVKGVFDNVCFAAIENNQIIGAMTLKSAENNIIHIGLLAVLPQKENCGVATALIQNAINFAKEQNIVVSTQISNLNAIQLYQKFNAKITQTAYWFYKIDNDSF